MQRAQNIRGVEQACLAGIEDTDKTGHRLPPDSLKHDVGRATLQ